MRQNGYHIAHEANITIYLKAVASSNNLNHVALRRNPKMNFFYGSNGDQAGCAASPGVTTLRRLWPVRSTEKI